MMLATRRVVLSVLALSALAMVAPRAQAATFGPGRARGRSVKTLVGSGRLRTETRKVRDLRALNLVIPTTVRITQGERESLTIEAEDNLLPLITTESRRGELTIDFRYDSADTVRTTRPIKVDVVVRELSKLSIPGESDVESPGLRAKTFSLSVPGAGHVKLNLQADETHVDLPGAAKIDLRLQAREVRLSMPGAGSCQLAGTVDRLQVDMSGSGTCAAAKLASRDARVAMSGAGTVEVRASRTLDASISGVGQILYAGQPAVTSHVSGMGKVRPL